MDQPNEVDTSNLRGIAESLCKGSVLLSPEAKVALLKNIEQVTNYQELSAIVAFLKDEKRSIVTHLRHLLKQNRIPGNVPELIGELRRDYHSRMDKIEAMERMEIPSSEVLTLLNSF